MLPDPQSRGANLDVLHNIESLLAYIELEFHILVSVNVAVGRKNSIWRGFP